MEKLPDQPLPVTSFTVHGSSPTPASTPASKVFAKQSFELPRTAPPLAPRKITVQPEGQEAEELSAIFDQIFSKTSYTIPCDSPFYNTDLIVFDDDYSGLFPLNGVKKSDFDKLHALYHEIVAGNTKIKIDKADPEFAKSAQEQFVTLLTRRVGREIIETLLHDPKLTKITVAFGEEKSCASWDEQDHSHYRVFLKLTDAQYTTTQGPDGLNRLIALPSFIVLGHELLHVMHDHSAKAPDKPTLHRDFDNIKEQQTITGITTALRWIVADDSAAMHHDYSALSENSLRAAFSLPFRRDHKTITKPRDLEISQNKASEESAGYLIFLVKYDLVYELAEFLQKNKSQNLAEKLAPDSYKGGLLFEKVVDKVIDHNSLSSFLLLSQLGIDPSKITSPGANGATWGLAEIVAAKNCGEVLAHLLKNEGSILAHQTDSIGNSLMHIAIGLGQSEDSLFGETDESLHKPCDKSSPLIEILQLLHQHGADLSQQNSAGDSPLHLTARNGSFRELTYLVKNGAKLSLQNAEGDTPLHIVMRGNSAALDAVRHLLESGASLTVKNRQGINPMQHAFQNLDPKLEVVQMLLKRPDFATAFKDPKNGLGIAQLQALLQFRLIGLQNPSMSFEEKAKVIADLITSCLNPQDEKCKQAIEACPSIPLREAIKMELAKRISL